MVSQLNDLHLADARTGAPMYALTMAGITSEKTTPTIVTTIITDKSRRQHLRTTIRMLAGIETKEDLRIH